jgi:uncharacterized membrane protein
MNNHQNPSPHRPRLWEVDTLRGIAIVLMICYHFMWDLNFFGVYRTDILGTAWQTFARSIATLFLLVLGVSLTLSYTAYRRKTGHTAPFQKYLLRGLQVFGLGLLITIGTYFFVGDQFVIFGILHLLGASIIAAYPFLGHVSHKWVSLVAGLVIIGLGIYLDTLVVDHPWLIWLGVKQASRGMVDYYPFFPWFGIALLGVFAGYTFYPEGQLRFSLPPLSDIAPVRGLRFLGRHSLLIYLVHQPLIIGLFFGLGYGSL